MDAERLKASFAAIADQGDQVVLYFYADLFFRAPHLREMFPVAMPATRDRLLAALGAVVSRADDLESLVPLLSGLGRDHRKFGVRPEHFGLVGEALLSTLAVFSGDAWSGDLERDWGEAFAAVAAVMLEAAAADEDAGSPPWWSGEVVSSERRGLETAVLRVAVKPDLRWLPGQSVAVRLEDDSDGGFSGLARTWRFLSPANPPRLDGPDAGTADFHVRAVPGGLLSTYLVRNASAGMRLRLGPAVGSLTLPAAGPAAEPAAGPAGDLLLVAGGTGLAPLLAIVHQIAARGAASGVFPAVGLLFGSHELDGLYARRELDGLAVRHDWLSVTYAASEGACGCPGGTVWPGSAGEVLAQELAAEPELAGRSAYVCGPGGMVAACRTVLAGAGVPVERIHVEDYG